MQCEALSIRHAALADAEAIAGLAGQLGYPTSVAEVCERLAVILADDGHVAYVAQTAEDRVVGWVHVFGTHRLIAESFAEIGGIVVDDAHRACGVGRALVEAAERWAQGEGYGFLRVRSNTARTGPYQFYERLGFRCLKTQYAFIKALPTLDTTYRR